MDIWGGRRNLLSRRRETLNVALRIIDEEGLEALSIRRLGRELDVQGISLYYHFKNKDAILVGVCELALTDVRTPKSADLDWQEWLFQNVLAYRRALLAHPSLVPVLMKPPPAPDRSRPAQRDGGAAGRPGRAAERGDAGA